MEEKIKTVAYIRVSTSEQSAEDRFGIEAQKQAIQEYADNHNMEIVQFFIDVISGVKDDRPEFNKILFAEDITNPPFKAVLVYKNDRIARDTKLFFYYLYKLQCKGIEIISVNEEINEDDPMANVMRSLMIFCAEQERRNITMRTTNGRKVKALKGGYSGGRPPLGYEVIDKKLVIKESEKDIVCRIFAMHDDNLSYDFIAKDLNSMGLRTRSGTEWTMAHIYYIVKNKMFYQGYYKYGNDEWVKGQHEAILGE